MPEEEAADACGAATAAISAGEGAGALDGVSFAEKHVPEKANKAPAANRKSPPDLTRK